MATNAIIIKSLKTKVREIEEYIADAQIDLKFARENLTDIDIHDALEALNYYIEARDTALFKIQFYLDPSNNVDMEF